MSLSSDRRKDFFESEILPHVRTVLEFGPFDRPVATPRKGTYYADYLDYDTLVLKAREAAGIGRDDNSVVKVDYVLSEMSISEIDRKFDCIVASHVFEHVADPIGWLHEVHAKLNDKGIIFFAIPDKRFTKDGRRPLTSIGNLLDRWQQNAALPSVGAVFDGLYYHLDTDAGVRWLGAIPNAEMVPPFDKRLGVGRHFVQTCYKRAKAAQDHYVDAHVNIWTKDSFNEAFLALGPKYLEIVPFEIERIENPVPPFNDFFVILRKV